MKSLYAQYIKEREGKEVIEDRFGFIVYKIEEDCAAIFEYFTLPKRRKKGRGFAMADEVFKICKKKGVEVVFCQSDERAKGWEIANLTILKYGFKEYMKKGPVHYYSMEVSKWVQ